MSLTRHSAFDFTVVRGSLGSVRGYQIVMLGVSDRYQMLGDRYQVQWNPTPKVATFFEATLKQVWLKGAH